MDRGKKDYDLQQHSGIGGALGGALLCGGGSEVVGQVGSAVIVVFDVLFVVCQSSSSTARLCFR